MRSSEKAAFTLSMDIVSFRPLTPTVKCFGVRESTRRSSLQGDVSGPLKE